ncbi:SIMPL domain-containing protein [Halobellus inordinatus]|uniref:SIMPL domain-containing protein n=1 Tax=Halobellus inordinatus TaxID=1126236 RepID=UPI00210BA0BB|nr:SIMPL domain-containing protein [Halobellus inordinatus]
MNRRIGFTAVLVAALVLLAGCSGPLQSTTTDAAPTGGAADGTAAGDVTRTISTTGTGEVSADADRAVVTVAVTARADTAEAARSAVAENATQMRDALRDAGVDDESVTTASYRLQPYYADVDRKTSERDVAGYEAVHAYRIETTPDAAGTVVDTAIGNGASEVYGVQFTLSAETRAELRERALERAMNAARTDADAVAAAANLTVTGVQSASTGGDYGPVYAVRETASDAGGAPTQFDAGSVTVTARVDVTYTAA